MCDADLGLVWIVEMWMVPFIRVDGAVGRVILAQYSPPRGVARRRPTQCGGMQAAGAGALNCKLGRIRYGVRARTPARVSIRGSWNDSRRQLDIGADTAVCRCRVVQYSTVQSSGRHSKAVQSSPVLQLCHLHLFLRNVRSI